jgi:hypothetical protein
MLWERLLWDQRKSRRIYAVLPNHHGYDQRISTTAAIAANAGTPCT